MSGEISLDGKEYISSKRASELSGYAQDYIGQLARGGNIDAQRVGGLWYVSMPTLQAYQEHAEAYKPQQPERIRQNDPDSLISFDGKDYISAARAAKITGYHQDYVGQLARTGGIISRQVGNRWYVQREALLEHKNEKDALLGAVQAESVGIRHEVRQDDENVSKSNYFDLEPQFIYTRDDGALMPELEKSAKFDAISDEELLESPVDSRGNAIPIHIVERRKILDHTRHVKHVKSDVRIPRKTIFYGTLAGAALTVVIVLSFGFSTLKSQSTYAINLAGVHSPITRNAFTASAAEAFGRIGDLLEKWLVPELTYHRSN